MSDDPLEALKAELQRRVGRNLLRYQAIEQMMKFLLVNAKVSITAQGPAPAFLKRQEAILRQTMGQLRDQYFRELLSDAGEVEDESMPTNVPRLTTTFHLDCGPGSDDLIRQQAAFASMVEDRNNLVHHFLSQKTLATAEQFQDAIDHLERQREKVIPLHDHLKSLVDALVAGRKQMAEFLASDEATRQFELHFLQQSRLVAVLFQASQVLGTAEGWLPLSTAGHVLRREATEDFQAMHQRYGHRTLKQLVIATELFEINDEMLPSGGFRTRYRVKPEIMSGPPA